ncbi:MAG: signal recognition particle-docking protein FtsY [Candidatus Korarchaeota archaeon]
MFGGLKKVFSAFVSKITTKELNEKSFENVWEEVFPELIKNDISAAAADRIHDILGNKLLGTRVKRFSNIEEHIMTALRETIIEILNFGTFDIVQLVKEKKEKPAVIAFFGINGTGKTTTIAKVARLLQKSGLSPVLAAADTYRAGSIEQLEEHCRRINARIVKQEYGADPAAVAWDAIESARNKHDDAVLIDTSGRMHTERNLMDELQKIIKIAEPDYKVLVVDALTGNDSVLQAEMFNGAVGVDGVIVAKMDADAKGGVPISVATAIKKPIIYLGVGQNYDDLIPFSTEIILKILSF